MELLVRADQAPRRLGVFPGAYNPPTLAHAAVVAAALREVDEVLLALPRSFPHKAWDGATLPQRADMLRLLAEMPGLSGRTSVGLTDGGLFREIAAECHRHYGPQTELWFLCGRDAAERILGWDYGEPSAVPRMLQQFGMLVAPRQGCYQDENRHGGRVRTLPMEQAWDEVSATAVRQRIVSGEPWEHLVPPPLVSAVRDVYR